MFRAALTDSLRLTTLSTGLLEASQSWERVKKEP